MQLSATEDNSLLEVLLIGRLKWYMPFVAAAMEHLASELWQFAVIPMLKQHRDTYGL